MAGGKAIGVGNLLGGQGFGHFTLSKLMAATHGFASHEAAPLIEVQRSENF